MKHILTVFSFALYKQQIQIYRTDSVLPCLELWSSLCPCKDACIDNKKKKPSELPLYIELFVNQGAKHTCWTHFHYIQSFFRLLFQILSPANVLANPLPVKFSIAAGSLKRCLLLLWQSSLSFINMHGESSWLISQIFFITPFANKTCRRNCMQTDIPTHKLNLNLEIIWKKNCSKFMQNKAYLTDSATCIAASMTKQIKVKARNRKLSCVHNECACVCLSVGKHEITSCLRLNTAAHRYRRQISRHKACHYYLLCSRTATTKLLITYQHVHQSLSPGREAFLTLIIHTRMNVCTHGMYIHELTPEGEYVPLHINQKRL